MWDTITGLLPAIMAYIPMGIIDPLTNVIGVAAVGATLFAKPNSQYARKAHKLLNIVGFNFGKAANKE
jgi:hypothetical protein